MLKEICLVAITVIALDKTLVNISPDSLNSHKSKINTSFKDSVKLISPLVLTFDSNLNNKRIQIFIDSNKWHDFLILKVNGAVEDTGIINLDVNTYYPSYNIFTFQDNYERDSLNLRRIIVFKNYLYITFGNMGMLRQLFVLDMNRKKFIKSEGWTTSIWTYILGFIVDGDKIMTCDQHPDPTYQYSRMPFSIYQVKDGNIKVWKKFKYNVPSAAIGSDDSMRSFMHKLLQYYKTKYR